MTGTASSTCARLSLLSSPPRIDLAVLTPLSLVAQQLTAQLTPDNFVVNNAVLQTAHSIFRSWRSEFRTDDLFLQIKFVLDRFCEPYFKLFQVRPSFAPSP
mgnify:CR=1 FL=1